MRGTSKAPSARSKSLFLKRLRTRFGITAALMAVVALVLPGAASADPLGSNTDYATPSATLPFTLTEAADGNMWYTDPSSNLFLTGKKIARVTPEGTVTEYTPGMAGGAYGIAKGPEETVWLSEPVAQKVEAVKVSAGEAIYKSCSVPGLPTEVGEARSLIVEGADKNLWVTLGANGIARVTPECVVTEFKAGLNAEADVCSITAGPDENVWFGDCGTTKAVGKITKTGTITEYPVAGVPGNQPESIALGSDGRLWFPANNAADERLGAITTAGIVTYYKTPTAPASFGLSSLTAGSDKNVWGMEASGTNETQTVSITATGGTYKLKFEGQETSALAFNASAATVKSALAALSTIGGSTHVSVSSSESKRLVTFTGKFARTDVSLMECISALTFEEGPGECSVATTTKPLVNRLFRITPVTGALKEFPLKPATRLQSLTKANALASGPGGNVWYTGIEPKEPTKKFIGKFGVEPNPELTVVKEGTGDGTVVSSPAGIECDPTCSAEFAKEAKVTLTASPDSESLFVSWKGCEVGGVNGRQCKVTMDKAKTVTAKFIQAYDVTVSRKGTGLGKVGSVPGGVLCLSNCSSTTTAFKEATNVTLTATPSKHFTFTGWSGDCTGTGTCVLSALSADKAVEAEFTEVPKFDLMVTKTGGGQGTVKAKQAGINCGVVCASMAAKYYEGEVIELLVPVPGKGSTFAGWSGSGCSGTGTCLVTMSSAKSVEAKFE